MLLGAWLCYLQYGFSWKCGHTFFLAKKEPFLILHANVIWDTPDYEWHV